MKRWMQFLIFTAILPLFLSLAACGPTGKSVDWHINQRSTGIVTSDPEKLPDLSWQTAGQRQVLSQQSQQQEAAPAETGGTPVKVALLVPMNGKNANLGQAMMKSAQLALFDVGSHKFELVPVDTSAGAALAAQQAVAGGANLILGPIYAEDVKAAKPVAASAQVPMVAFSTDWTLADGNTYVFGFLPFMQVSRVAQYAESRGLGRVGVIAPKTEYADLVVATLDRSNVRPVATLRYAAGQADLGHLVRDFAQTQKSSSGNFNFNAMLLPLGGESLRSLTALLDQYGIRGSSARFLGTGLWDDPAALADPTLNGGWFAAPDPKARRDFESRYAQTYGGVPPRLSTLAYDATALAAVLARSDTSGRPYTRDRMTAARGFAGIDGVFRFRSDGLAERGLAVLEIGGGAARVVDPAPTAFTAGG